MSYDTEINDILGHIFKFSDKYRTDHVKVRDLLTHRTGIPRYDFLWIAGQLNKEEIFQYVCHYHSSKVFHIMQ